MKRMFPTNVPLEGVPAVVTFRRANRNPPLSAEQENPPAPVIVMDWPDENQRAPSDENSRVKTGEVANPEGKLNSETATFLHPSIITGGDAFRVEERSVKVVKLNELFIMMP